MKWYSAVLGFLLVFGVFILNFFVLDTDRGNVGVGYNPAFGWEYLDNDSVFVMWNTPPSWYEYTIPYFFNASNGVQFTNEEEGYWTRNVFCAGYNTGSWTYKCVDKVNFTWSLTNTSNEINLTGYKDIIVSNRTVRFGIRYSLGVNDTNLTIIPFAYGLVGSVPNSVKLGFLWKITDVDIGLDNQTDWLRVNKQTYYLNSSFSILSNNLSETKQTFADEDEFLWMSWNPNSNYWYSADNESSKVLITTNGLNEGQLKSTKMEWLDAIKCTWTCTTGTPTSPFEETINVDWSHTGKWTLTSGFPCPFVGEIYGEYYNQTTWARTGTIGGDIVSDTSFPISKTSNNFATWNEHGTRAGDGFGTRTKCVYDGTTKYSYGVVDEINITAPTADPTTLCNWTDITSSVTLSADNYSCFNVTSNNVVLDCDVYSFVAYGLTRNDSALKAYNINNFTVQNCTYTGWTRVMELYNVSNVTIKDTNIYNTSNYDTGDVLAIGINVSYSDNINISNLNLTYVWTESVSLVDCWSLNVYGVYSLENDKLFINDSIINRVYGTGFGVSGEACNEITTHEGLPVYDYNSTNTTILNTEFKDNYDSVYLYYNANTNFSNNVLDNSTQLGATFREIIILEVFNNTFNNIGSGSYDSLSLNDVFNISIKNNNITNCDLICIRYDKVDYTKPNMYAFFTNNFIDSGASSGIYINADELYKGLNISDNVIKNLRGGNGVSGIYLDLYLTGANISNNLIYNVSALTGVSYGIFGDNKMILKNNNITDVDIGVRFTSDSDNSTVTNDIWVTNVNSTELKNGASNISFYNVTFNISTTDVQSSGSALAHLYVYYYVQVNVTKSTDSSAINNAYVNFTDKNGVKVVNTTNVTGLTPWITLISFNESANTQYFFSNYSINVSRTSYDSNSATLNLTESVRISIVLTPSGADTCTPGVNWLIDGDICIKSGVEITTDNLTIINAGQLIMTNSNLSISCFNMTKNSVFNISDDDDWNITGVC